MKKSLLFWGISIFACVNVVYADAISKETIRSQNKLRSYHVFVPDKLDKTAPAPLIVVLHGSGDSGLMPVKRWKEYAQSEGIIIAGPNALDPQNWRIPDDAPEFIYEMIESLKKKHPIDPRRVYLFGHSGGAIVALYLALMQSEYFAAAAIHAGAIRPEDGAVIDRAKRKIPISLFVGTRDNLFPVEDLRQTRKMLGLRGFYVELHEIRGHNHEYGSRSDLINGMIWNFFKQIRLDREPRHQLYRW
jgi:polyhydroxybutyrate depolymerase